MEKSNPMWVEKDAVIGKWTKQIGDANYHFVSFMRNGREVWAYSWEKCPTEFEESPLIER